MYIHSSSTTRKCHQFLSTKFLNTSLPHIRTNIFLVLQLFFHDLITIVRLGVLFHIHRQLTDVTA